MVLLFHRDRLHIKDYRCAKFEDDLIKTERDIAEQNDIAQPIHGRCAIAIGLEIYVHNF